MSIHAIHIPLGSIASIRAGHPFRGAIQEVRGGPVRVVQMKDLDPVHGLDWRGVILTRPEGRREPDWLVAGDLLLVARGTRFHASCVDEVPGPAVCGPHLFRLRIQAESGVLPAFLAWQINQAPFQRALRRAAEGSSQLSVRRPVLESLLVGVPPLADQAHIVELDQLAHRQLQLQDQLIRNRERQFESIAEALASAPAEA